MGIETTQVRVFRLLWTNESAAKISSVQISPDVGKCKFAHVESNKKEISRCGNGTKAMYIR